VPFSETFRYMFQYRIGLAAPRFLFRVRNPLLTIEFPNLFRRFFSHKTISPLSGSVAFASRKSVGKFFSVAGSHSSATKAPTINPLRTEGRHASIDVALIRQMKAQGLGATAITKELGIGRASVCRVLEGDSI
jgi:hypothetical protein